MTKRELVQLINSLPSEDKEGTIHGIFYDRYGSITTTDSIRIDMDGGRIILAQKGSERYEANKKNWLQEIKFYEKNK